MMLAQGLGVGGKPLLGLLDVEPDSNPCFLLSLGARLALTPELVSLPPFS
jgi:hypothetical protein